MSHGATLHFPEKVGSRLVLEAFEDRLPRRTLLGNLTEFGGDGSKPWSAIAHRAQHGAKDVLGPDLAGTPQNEAAFPCQFEKILGGWKQAGERIKGFGILHRKPRSPAFHVKGKFRFSFVYNSIVYNAL